MHMKRLRTITGLLALCGMTAFFTGCGGDDNDTSGTVTTTPNTPVTPAGNAPSTLQGQSLYLVSTDTRTISFATSGNNYTLSIPGSPTESGTYTAVKSGDTWTVTTTDTAGNVNTLTLNFSSDGVGTYSYTTSAGTTPG